MATTAADGYVTLCAPPEDTITFSKKGYVDVTARPADFENFHIDIKIPIGKLIYVPGIKKTNVLSLYQHYMIYNVH